MGITANQNTTQSMNGPEALTSWLRELQERTFMFTLPTLGLAGLVILGSFQTYASPPQAMLAAAIVFAWVGMIWMLREWHYIVAAILLVTGTVTVTFYISIANDNLTALVLLAISVGIATLTISRWAGAITASVCTIVLLRIASSNSVIGPSLLNVSLLMIWSTFGLLWLTLKPLLTAITWAWASYEQMHTLLEDARDTQVQLHETLEDLASANLQFTRLNRQAQGLRQIAEDERRAKEEFVANVSHELRTPLNMIVGFCEMITRAPETYGSVPGSLLADLAVVLRNGQHLSNLVDDVLDLSQIEANQMALSKETVAFDEIISAVTVAVRPLFRSKGLYLKTNIADNLPPLLCDRTRIREVLLNLLSNAGRFTQQGGVTITVSREGDDLLVSVQDTGPGIPDEDQSRIFRPFEQLDGSIRRKHGGTGLGLAISKSFVELHDGRMWLESEVGAGTTFFFTLPLFTQVTLESNPVRWITPGWEFLQRTHPTRVPEVEIKPRFVVAERGKALERLLTRYLDSLEIVRVTNLDEALIQVNQVPTQGLLVNDVNVSTALQEINTKPHLPLDVPIVICNVPDADHLVGELGVFDYLVKPISQDALLQTLACLEGASQTILIVDNEPDALRLFRRMLLAANRGYQVLRANTGQQAWEMLQTQAVDVILLDLIMPEMNGFEFLARKNEDSALQDIPVILISAQDPLGQPFVSDALAVTRGKGFTAREILASLEALQQILGPPAPQSSKRPNVASSSS